MIPSTPNDAVIAGPADVGRQIMVALNASAVIVAALYFGRELLIPLVLASLLAFVLAPGCTLLQRAKLPRVAAVFVVVLLAFAALGGIGLIVGRQIAQLAASLPAYEVTVLAKWHALAADGGWIQRLLEGVGLAADRTATPQASGAATFLGLENVTGLVLAKSVALPLLGPLGTAGVVLVFTIFILLSNDDLRDRLVRLAGRRDLHRTILAMNDAARRLSRYFLFQLALNAAFGILIGLSLWLVGLPNPILWGILASLMRFVPFIGTFIALAPPLMLAVAVVPGWSLALIVLALFVCIELAMAQVIEPLIYGHSTGLSPIAIIVATAFWAFLWGPVGLLLATPLTVCLVVLGRHVQPLAFLDVILGDSPPLMPSETFYQRALEKNGAALVTDARKHIRAASLADYYDTVALRGLVLAQDDLARDTLAFERLEGIHVQIAHLLKTLGVDAVPLSNRSLPPSAWQRSSSVLCIPGRGQLDDLTAVMAAQVLQGAGFGAQESPNLILGSGSRGHEDFSFVRLCCLSVLEMGSSASSIRYFVRRIQRKMPSAAIVVCLWHAPGNSPLLAALRADGDEEHLIMSVGELLALAQALTARGNTRVPESYAPVATHD